MDRSAIARALAKAIAYKACGKHLDATEWARELVRLLECSEILTPVVYRHED
jgi:hypothetical protein